MPAIKCYKNITNNSNCKPVVKPIRAFSPPSNPAIHHSLIGPMDFVGTPPGNKKVPITYRSDY